MTSETNPPSDDSIRAGYELKDVNIRAILWLGAGIAVTAIVVQIALWFLTVQLERGAKQNDPIASPLAAERQSPPGPQLQSTPNDDYAEFRAQQAEQLASYGWIDKERKIARIPITRAVEIVAEKGNHQDTKNTKGEEGK
jgi:hypothetical protein